MHPITRSFCVFCGIFTVGYGVAELFKTPAPKFSRTEGTWSNVTASAEVNIENPLRLEDGGWGFAGTDLTISYKELKLLREAQKQPIEWLGLVTFHDKKWATTATLVDHEIGLRSDGVLVWRKAP